jgi:hypothetical protein
MLVTHFQISGIVRFRNQTAENNLAAFVFRPDQIASLVIMKNGFRGNFAARGILN